MYIPKEILLAVFAILIFSNSDTRSRDLFLLAIGIGAYRLLKDYWPLILLLLIICFIGYVIYKAIKNSYLFFKTIRKDEVLQNVKRSLDIKRIFKKVVKNKLKIKSTLGICFKNFVIIVRNCILFFILLFNSKLIVVAFLPIIEHQSLTKILLYFSAGVGSLVIDYIYFKYWEKIFRPLIRNNQNKEV